MELGDGAELPARHAVGAFSGQARYLNLTSQIVSSYVSNNKIEQSDFIRLIGEIHEVVRKLDIAPDAATPANLIPAVPVKKSVTADYIICLEDGKRFKSMKRHLSARYNLTPEAYRRKWGLGPEYPMVAPNYAQSRSHLAKQMKLGARNHKYSTEVA